MYVLFGDFTYIYPSRSCDGHTLSCCHYFLLQPIEYIFMCVCVYWCKRVFMCLRILLCTFHIYMYREYGLEFDDAHAN